MVLSPGNRMRETAALGTDFWNDSCSLRELTEAVAAGAVGATSNPVIVHSVVNEDRAHWIPVLDEFIKRYPRDTEDELAWKLIAEIAAHAAKILYPIFESSHGEKGSLSVQLNPKFYRDPHRMVTQAKLLNVIAPNISIKAPLTEAGLAAIEEMTAEGIRVNATVSFTLPQILACARAMERGHPKRKPYITLMVGRLDDHLKRQNEALKLGVDPKILDWAGIAVAKKAYRILKDEHPDCSLLIAAYRHEKHWRECVGPGVIQTIPYAWWTKFQATAEAPRSLIDEPVDPAILKTLQEKFPDFVRAYSEDGIAPEQFATYGATLHTLQQFLGC